MSRGDRLAGELSARIARGDFRAGQRLPAEGDLALRFGVSRPVVREALARLRATGIVVSRKGSGSFVRAEWMPVPEVAAAGFGPVSSLAQVRRCYEFRACVEAEAAFHAARNRTPDLLAAMRGALQGIDAAIAGGAVGMAPDYEFHLAVARASGNEFFAAVMESMRTPIEFSINLARSLSLKRPIEHVLDVQAKHVAIYRAIEAGDGAAARRVMRDHIEAACSRVFEGPPEQAPPAA